jgi:hypothetical protein
MTQAEIERFRRIAALNDNLFGKLEEGMTGRKLV